MNRLNLQWISPGDARTASSVEAADENARPRPTVILTPREKVIFLLHVAAEVEHSLLVQYLYAAYSLSNIAARPELTATQKALLQNWQDAISRIAIEEMAHLLTVQNCLIALGGPSNFDREDYPFRSDFYPFPFQLRPLTLSTLARFVAAEMPALSDVPVDERWLVRRIVRKATAAVGTTPINRVGPLYDEIIESIDALQVSDFVSGYAVDFQGSATDWGASPDQTVGRIIWTIDSPDKAKRALTAVRNQGEAPDNATTAASHFRRFLDIYKQFRTYDGPPAAMPVATDPHSSPRPSRILREERARITHPCTLLWAQLADLRYRMVLFTFQHYLQLSQQDSAACRAKLVEWLNCNMKIWIRGLSVLLASKPRKNPAIVVGGHLATAGNPFQLPFSFCVPFGTVQQWMTHRDMARASQAVIVSLRKCVTDNNEHDILNEIEAFDMSVESTASSQVANPGGTCDG